MEKKISNSEVNEKIQIQNESELPMPMYVRNLFQKYSLKYYVSKVDVCPQVFDIDLIIFKFESQEFKKISDIQVMGKIYIRVF